MNILFITGGTGFFGKNVLKYISEVEPDIIKFDEILILTRNSKKFINQHPEFNDLNIQFIEGDVRTFKLNRNDINYIMHLATDTDKAANEKDPMNTMDVIISGTKNVLSFAMMQKQLKKFLFASSGAVYGDIPEDISGVKEYQSFHMDFTDPINSYALAKRTAEMMCLIYKQNYGIPLVIARGFAFYGDYLPMDAHFAIGNFIKDAKEKRIITIISDGMTKRSYMHSRDLAICLVQLLISEKTSEVIYNVGSENAKTLKEWAYFIAENLDGVTVKILNQPQIGYSACKNYIPNIDRLKKLVSTNNFINLSIQ